MVLNEATPDQLVPLFTEFNHLPLSEYLKQHGAESLSEHPLTRVAQQVAMIKINPEIINLDDIKPGSEILITSFDSIKYLSVIDSITVHENSRVLRGKITGTDNGYISLSFTGGLGLGTIKIADYNAAYLIRFNHDNKCHYLFKAPMDEIEKPIQ